MYLTDPEHGQRRRAALRRHVTRMAQDAADTLDVTGREAMDRLQHLDHQGRQAGREAQERLQMLAAEGRHAGRKAWHRAEDLAHEGRDRLSAWRGAEPPVRQARPGAGRLLLPVLGGIAIGAAAMFLLEPQQRSRRWALVRDQALRLGRSGADLVGVDPHDLGARAKGLATRAAGLLQGTPPEDAVLVQRVRGALQRVLSQPDAIHVTADSGRVGVSGSVPAEELARLYECAAAVRGVSQVRDEGLEVQGSAHGVQAVPRRVPLEAAPASPAQG